MFYECKCNESVQFNWMPCKPSRNYTVKMDIRVKSSVFIVMIPSVKKLLARLTEHTHFNVSICKHIFLLRSRLTVKSSSIKHDKKIAETMLSQKIKR